MIDFQKVFFDGVEGSFIAEIIGRTIVMFLLILLVLRLSGRRGVRQLTLFEVAIILALGSAAGDPMFQENIPIVYAVIVLSCVIGVYKLMTWLASRSSFVSNLLEGKAMVVVKEGMFDLKHENDNNYSKMEFFAELRNQSVEHLGQVSLGVLEVDGTLSLLFYADEEVKYGLPLFPTRYEQVDVAEVEGPFACMYCGFVLMNFERTTTPPVCGRCHRKKWTQAIRTKRGR